MGDKQNGFKNRTRYWICRKCGERYGWSGWGEEPEICANCMSQIEEENKKKLGDPVPPRPEVTP